MTASRTPFRITDPVPSTAIPIRIMRPEILERWLPDQPRAWRNWIDQRDFDASGERVVRLADESGRLACVLLARNPSAIRQLADLPGKLPAGDYYLATDHLDADIDAPRVETFLGWGLASYVYDRYRQVAEDCPRLVLPAALAEEVSRLYQATSLVRDLVNTPTQDLGPAQLADEVELLAQSMDAEFRVIVGDELLDENFPAIHAVGRAAATNRAPRLIRLDWGAKEHPLLVLVGKGVCFDSGGLDIKPASGMLKMKKDMGGAAHALALAQLVMAAELPVRLMLLIPAVENAISGDAYRPGDVVRTRKGLTVEIGNTDAEGRVILADALALAMEHDPDLVIDFATLTGAARVALGPDLPPLFANSMGVSDAIMRCGDRCDDPLWPLPLYKPYASALKSKIADINNITSGLTGAGAITAALFLEKFVDPGRDWVHIDTYAWNDSDRPGRPRGGEAMGLRAVYGCLRERYQHE